jgi:predicted histidine transporter YuiF (NhaC family)
MRALCGAIITAGALIGLGLIGIGLGIRYQDVALTPTGDSYIYVRFRHLDTAMAIAFIALVLTLLVGLATAFVGLAYHHERRHREHLLHTSVAKPNSVEP